MTAVVEAINYETREVVLRGPEGNTRTITASPEEQNLDQVKPGDLVNVEYIQNISIEVFANDGSEPGTGSLSVIGRAKKGQEPGVTAMETQIVTAIVEDINIEANTFKCAGRTAISLNTKPAILKISRRLTWVTW